MIQPNFETPDVRPDHKEMNSILKLTYFVIH